MPSWSPSFPNPLPSACALGFQHGFLWELCAQWLGSRTPSVSTLLCSLLLIKLAITLVIGFFSPTRAGCNAMLKGQLLWRLLNLHSPFLLSWRNWTFCLKSSSFLSSCQKDPLQILKTKIFYLLLGTKLHCKDNQIPFSQSHRQLIADAAHPKGTARKSSQSARWFCYPVSFGQGVCAFLFEKMWGGQSAFKAVLVLPWVKHCRSALHGSFTGTDTPEIESLDRAAPREQHKCCSWYHRICHKLS